MTCYQLCKAVSPRDEIKFSTWLDSVSTLQGNVCCSVSPSAPATSQINGFIVGLQGCPNWFKLLSVIRGGEDSVVWMSHIIQNELCRVWEE